MSAKALSPAEKMILQSGAVMKVNIVGQEGDSYTVSLPISSKLDSIKPFQRPVSKKIVNKHAAPVDTKPKVLSAPGPLLVSLKTGMPLTGTVSFSTSYAAFLDVGVFREGKGGIAVPVNAMLHRLDLDKKLLRDVQYKRSYTKNLIEKGTSINVYVKEVFKNSG
jgi:hypothetical protein